ncbi:hypothetical protein LTR56_025573 [Elasticomyces elasticus]|nr:hypothetical protein LTR56_025573 [Elasticomyces elasticus]
MPQNSSVLLHRALGSTIDSAGAGGDEVNASGLNQLVTPANTTQDAREHSITDVEGVIPHLTMVHPVEEVMQET